MDQPPQAPEVFICYAHTDADRIETDLKWLVNRGVAVWYDHRIPGGNIWRDELAHAIDCTSAVVYFLSEGSKRSQHCQREIHFAIERDKPVVPVYLENVRLSAGLELTLNRHQAIFKYRMNRAEYQTMLLSSLMPHLGRSLSAPSTKLGLDDVLLRPQRYAIAVLPFANLSDDPDQVYFGEGLAEDLINGLSQSRELIVKARSSSFRLQDRERDFAGIGRLLNVTHMVHGSVRKAQNRIRVNVQLIETTDERVVWSDRYDRQIADVFALQDEITNAILRALDTELRPRAYKGAEVPINAYNAYVRGRYHQERMELLTAIEAFEQAVSLEPCYTDAHAALAGAHRAMGGPMIPRGDRLNLVRDHIERALSVDPQHPVALSHRAGIRFFADREYQTAIYEFDRLVRQFPSTPFGGYQAALHTIGRFDLALSLTRRTLEVNPLSPQTHQDRGMHLREMDQLNDALKSFEEAERLGVDIPHEHAEVEFRRGDSKRLSAHLGRIGKVFGGRHTRYLMTRASLLFLQNNFRQAKSLLSNVEQSKAQEDMNWMKALFALRANEPGLAVDFYSRALEGGELQAFVFCQPCEALERLFPEFFSSSERSRMLQSVGLDPDSLRKLDVPPLPAWAQVED